MRVLIEMGIVLREQGKHRQALQAFEIAYHQCLEALGPEHPHTVSSRNYLRIQQYHRGL